MKRIYNCLKDTVTKILKFNLNAITLQGILLFLLLIFVNHAQAADRYWVGKGTDAPIWGTAANWSATSGGAGGATVPKAGDNVFFDNNSFSADGQSVTLYAGADFNNMVWTATNWNPIFDINSRILTISGSLQLQEHMTVLGNSTGAINFTSVASAGETIITNNVAIPKYLSFNTSGKWKVQGALNIGTFSISISNGTLDLNGPVICGTFTHSSGTLNLNGMHLTCSTFSSTSNSTKSLKIVNSTIDAESWFYYGTAAAALTPELTAGSLIRVKKDFMGKNTDYYNIVEAGSGTLQCGIFKKLIMNKHNGTLCSNTSTNTVVTDSLILDNMGNPSGMTTYNIFFGRTITINRYLGNINYSDCKFTELRSNSSTNVTLAMGASSNVNLSNVYTYYMVITGPGAPYPVSNYFNLGGTQTGWVNSTTEVPQRLYRVNGAGNWNDPNHWSLTSGGTGNCYIPSAGTTVVFDDNSGFTNSTSFTLETNIVCDSMLWILSSKPVFNLNTRTASISGSLLLQPGMTVTGGTGVITFNSTRPEGETIITNNVPIPKPITINGASTWSLPDSLIMSAYTLILNNANATLNVHKTISCNQLTHTNGTLNLYGTLNSNSASTFSNGTQNITGVLNTGTTFGFSNGTMNVNGALNVGTTFNYTNGFLNLDGGKFSCGTFSVAGSNSRKLSMVNAIIDVDTWTYSITTSLPLTPENTTGSLIRVQTAFSGKPTDYYNVVEAGSGTLQGGIFSKIIMNKHKGMLCSSTAANTVVTDTLILDNAGNPLGDATYYIYRGRNITVNRYLGNINVENCRFYELQSDANTVANIFMGEGAKVDMSNLTTYYIGAIGDGAPYTVNKYEDMGGSYGFTGTGATARKLFWVNGSGSWHDPRHWAIHCEDGSVSYGFLPSANTSVVFDENSGLTDGSTVTLNGHAFCDSMLWTGTHKPVFNLRNYDLNINGSLLLQPEMQVLSDLSAGYLNFTSKRQNETIITHSVQIPRSVFFNSPTGGWKVEDALVLKSGITFFKLTFTDGNLDLNGDIQCDAFISNANNARVLDISNAVIDAETWLHYNSTTPLTEVQTENSLVLTANNFTGVPTDHYNVVKAGAGVLQGGNFKKIIMMKDKGMLNTSLAENWVTTDSLVLYMGNEYRIYHGSVVHVNHYFGSIQNVGDCAERIVLKSDAASAAFLMMGENMEMGLSGTSLYYIVIDGPDKPYLITQGSDLGGSSGFISTSSNRLYWVNGPGNWSDKDHWSTTSGGPADACVIPQNMFSVVFDDNSGLTGSSTVTLDIDANCDSMIWKTTTTPVFNMSTYNLNIYGSIELQPKMSITSTTGTLTLSSARSNEIIKTNNVIIPRNIVFNNASGTWKLLDKLTLAAGKNITISKGTLNLNGNDMKCGTFSLTENTASRINIAHSVIDVDTWNCTGGGATPLSSAETAGSLIRVARDFTGKTNDNYAIVEAGAGTIQGGTFTKIIMNKNGGTLNGSVATCKADSLIFEMGNTYYLTASRTVTVTRYLGNTRATLDCSEKVTIKSTTPNSATFATSGAVVDLNNVNFYYITVTGNTPRLVPNSIDLGGCVGWTFSPPPPAQRLYWVGGSGNWQETSHWALTSGGTPACNFPSNKTTVIFDDNSGLTDGEKVTITGFTNCDSMIWTGSHKPVFEMAANLTISGSLELQPNMSIASSGDINFNSTRLNETIKTNNVPLYSALYFNSTGGWKLQDAIITNKNINFTNGNLDFSGKYVKALGFSSTGAVSRTLNFAGATIELTGSWQHTGNPVALTAANTQNSIIRFTSSFTGKSGDMYNVVEFKTGSPTNTLFGGSFKKIILNPESANRTITINNATASNDITTDTLLIMNSASGFICSIYEKSHLTINRYFGNQNSATGCVPEFTLKSSTTSPCFIEMGNDAEVHLEHVSINNVTINGQDAPYSVTNLVDLGGNTGWTNTPSQPVYWIGGAGNWNDLSHWSYQSGGASNVCEFPNGLVTVIFDEKSGLINGATVTLNGNYACDNMIWRDTTASVFNMNSKTFTISGSLELQPRMRITATTGGMLFNSNRAAGETIKTNLVQIPCNLTFNNPDGSWTLLDSLNQTGGTFTFTNGKLNFNGQYVQCGAFTSVANNNRQLNIANSVINTPEWTYTGNSVPPVTSHSTIKTLANFTVTPGNLYHNLEIINGTIVGGTFSKIVSRGFVSFNNSAAGVISTDTLLFASGSMSMRIFGGSAINVAKYMEKQHRDWLSLASTSTASAIINMGAGSAQSDVKMDTVMLQRITITGPGTDYPTTGSVNEGNNKGWKFIDVPHPASDDYFWREDATSLVFNNIDNWEVGYPGSKIRPLVIFNANQNVHFPPSSTHLDRTLTLTSTPSINFKNLYVSEGNNITISLGTVPVNAQGNISVTAGGLKFVGTGNLTVSGEIITANYSSFNVENMNVTAGGINFNDHSKGAIGTNLSKTVTNFTVQNNILLNNDSELTLTQNKIKIGKNLNIEGILKYTSIEGNTIDVGGDLNISEDGLIDINVTASTFTLNLKGNTMVGGTGNLRFVGGTNVSYKFYLYASGDVHIEGSAYFQNIFGYYSKNLTATGGVLFDKCDTYLQSVSPYTFNLGPQPENYFSGGYLRFDAPAAFSLDYDLIIPTTSLYITNNNNSFITNGNRLKALNLYSGMAVAAVSARKLDFSNSLIEVQGFSVHGTKAGEYDFTGTTVSFFSKVNRFFRANLIASSPIHKVTYSEAGKLLTFSYPTNNETSNKVVNVVIDSLITGDKGLNLDYTDGNISTNYWNIDRYCDIYTTASPVISAGKISCPPPATKCVGISQMHSTNGAVILKRTLTTDSQELRNIYFRNVNFSGTGSGSYSTAFNAPYNYDLGGNSGSITWTTPPDPEESIDFYWIGGTGNWMSDQHWSFTSGGAPANCIPTFLDNAIFDENSFTAASQFVTIDSVPTGIHHIFWTDATQRGGLSVNNILEVFGSVDFTGCKSISYSGYSTTTSKLIFLGRGLESITSGNCSLGIPIVQFDHSGTYELKDDFLLKQPAYSDYKFGIFHYSGKLVSNGHTITTCYFISTSPYSASRSIDFSNSTIKLLPNGNTLPNEYCKWQLDLTYLTDCNLLNSYILATYINTTGAAGQAMKYHDVEVHYQISQTAGLVVNYNDIYAKGNGITSSANSGYFNYGFTARNLYLEAYKRYTFSYSATLPNEYVITEKFTTNAKLCECNSDTVLTTISGSSATTRTPIRVVKSPFEINRASVKYINAVGETMYVSDGIDAGNNTNVVVTPRDMVPGRNFYWVPNKTAGNTGGGDWGDATHWSLDISGGNPDITNPNGCIPSQYDNVYFDINSFKAANQTVLVSKDIYCNNMTWEPETNPFTPSLTQSTLTTSFHLYIYGSLALTSGIKTFQLNNIDMMGTSNIEGAQTIRYNGYAGSDIAPIALKFSGGGRYDILDYCPTMIGDNNTVNTVYGVVVEKGSQLYIHEYLYSTHLTIAANSSLFARGTIKTLLPFTVKSGTQQRTIDISGATVDVSYLLWTLDNYTTVNISNANITTRSATTTSLFDFTSGPLCRWSARNSVITSSCSIQLSSNATKVFSFHNIIMTGQTEPSATLGTGATTGPFSFNKVQFVYAQTMIANANALYTFDTLQYALSSNNKIAAGKRLDINKKLIASGTPCGTLNLVSSGAPALINSVNCEPIVIRFAHITNVYANATAECPSSNYIIYGTANNQSGYNGWTFYENSDIAELLGNDTILDCRTSLPFVQTTEGLGVGSKYTWYYRPVEGTGAWTILTNGTFTPEYGITKTGEYSLYIEYATGCELGKGNSITRFVTIDQDPPPANISSSSITNNINEDELTITLTANITEDTSGSLYSYSWKDTLGNNWGTNPEITVSTPGIYTVTVTNDRYCVDSAKITIHQYPTLPNLYVQTMYCQDTPLIIDLFEDNKIMSCGKTDAEVVIRKNTQLGNVMITADNDIEYTQSGVVGLDTLKYAVICEDEQYWGKVCIAVLPAPNIVWITNPTATTSEDTLTIKGAFANTGTESLNSPIFFTYYMNDTLTSNIMTFDSVYYTLKVDSTYNFEFALKDFYAYGDYETIWLSINDRNGNYPYQAQCKEDGRRIVKILGGANPEIGTLFVNSHPTCGKNNGSVMLYIHGGSKHYEYSINGGSFKPYTGSLIGGLPAGTYRIEVRDKKHPEITMMSNEVILKNINSDISLFVTSTDASTCSATGGIISVVVSGGTKPYSLTMNGVHTNNTVFSGLHTGVYVIEAKDAEGCVANSGEIRISADAFHFNIDMLECTGSSCGKNEGAVKFDIQSDIPYRYQLDGMVVQEGISNRDTVEFTGLSAGSHLLHIFNNCGEDTMRFKIANNAGAPTDLTFTANVMKNVIELNNGTVTYGEIDLVVTGGVSPYSYTIDGGATWKTISGTKAVIPNLEEGWYKIELKDASNCTSTVNMVNITREPKTIELLNCAILKDQTAEEDYYQAGHYTHSGTAWDIVPSVYGVIDTLHYFINGKQYNNTLNGAIFPVGVSTVTVIAYLGDITNTCEFTVTVERVCPPSVTDIESHVYSVTKLAGLCWTSNLRTTKYADGTDIPFAKPYTCPTCPAQLDTIFGLIYDWYSATGALDVGALDVGALRATPVQGICPDGWHIPSQEELSLLGHYPAQDLKSVDYWLVPGTNRTGFNSRPAGRYNGALDRFEDLYGFTAYWSSDANPSESANITTITYYCSEAQKTTILKTDGISVRCVWDGGTEGLKD